MVIRFSQDEVRDILKKYVDSLGFDSRGVRIVYQDEKVCEYEVQVVLDEP